LLRQAQQPASTGSVKGGAIKARLFLWAKTPTRHAVTVGRLLNSERINNLKQGFENFTIY